MRDFLATLLYADMFGFRVDRLASSEPRPLYSAARPGSQTPPPREEKGLVTSDIARFSTEPRYGSYGGPEGRATCACRLAGPYAHCASPYVHNSGS